jgi:retron-type reverse transcriptase
MATVLVLGPIFEADLQPEQHAYRPERDALSAVSQVHGLLNAGYTQVIDADLAAYFDSIPHLELMKSVARRVVDSAMLHLIQMWLDAPVEESDEGGGTKRTTRNRDEKRGIPQGSPLSPLLSCWDGRAWGWRGATKRRSSTMPTTLSFAAEATPKRRSMQCGS